ncbi:MAG: SpoIIE family protein phosphatase [Bacteroidales bacterium]
MFYKYKLKVKFIHFKSFGSKLSFYIGILSLIIFGVIMFLFYSTTKERMRNHVVKYTHSLLSTMAVQVDNKLNAPEIILNNTSWLIIENKDNPEFLKQALREIVTNNSDIIGSSIAFKENYDPEKGKYYMYYAHRVGDEVEIKILDNESYDYLHMDWFVTPMAQKKSSWSEPYFDSGGGNELMCTYSHPLYDKDGELFAILTADISLVELNSLVEGTRPYNSAYTFMLSREGYYLSHYKSERVMTSTIFMNAADSNNKEFELIGNEMVKGKTGTIEFDNDGDPSYAFFTAIPDVGWSICTSCSTDVIFAELYSTLRNIIIIFLIGAFLLCFITFRIITRLSQPLSEVSKSAKEISNGNFEHKWPLIDSTDDIQALCKSFEHMQSSLVRYIEELKQSTKRRQHIESELQIARNIQQGMLPKIFPPFPNRNDIDIDATLIAAKEVGGDLYNFFIENNKLHFIIGDVSGKGVPASLVMAITTSLFNTVAHGEEDPKEIVAKLNAAVCSGNGTNNMFVTLIVGVLNLSNGKLRLCNAGHNPPILVKSNADTSYLNIKKNLPIGILPEFEYENDSLMISPQTKMIFYTDGVTEAENCSKELYGDKRLLSIIESTHREYIGGICSALLQDIDKHVDKHKQSDDLTILAIDYIPKNDNSMAWKLIIKNDKQEISKIETFVEEIGEQMQLSMQVIMNINLALEEAIANIIMYAYPKVKDQEIILFATHKENELIFLITDSGVPFDPTQVAEADILAPLEERNVGGLGIMLIRKIMNEITYQRIDGTNQLRLKKII